jgi:hypothetical protein
MPKAGTPMALSPLCTTSPTTRAKIFSKVGKQTPMLVRFSTVAGQRGAADAERDIRGTAPKRHDDSGRLKSGTWPGVYRSAASCAWCLRGEKSGINANDSGGGETA